jgi:hypothetical protein
LRRQIQNVSRIHTETTAIYAVARLIIYILTQPIFTRRVMEQYFIFKKYVAAFSITLLLSFFNVASAQVSERYRLQHERSFKLEFSPKTTLSFFGLGMISTANHTGTMNISFPYQTMDANGVKTSHVLNANSGHLLSGQSPELSLGLDISHPFYALTFGTGFNTTYGGAYYSIGYARALYLGQSGHALRDRVEKCTWILRPSLNITAFSFSGGNIGIIDNRNTTIYLLERTVNPTYTYSSGKSNIQHVVQSNELAINYKQNQIGIQPKIALCTNPYKTKISIQLFVSYFIPIFQSGGLQLIQRSSTDSPHFVSGSAGTKIKNHDDITATYNNQSFHSIPFRANNVFIGISLGITLF